MASPKPASRAATADLDKVTRSTTTIATPGAPGGKVGEPQGRDARGRFGAGNPKPKENPDDESGNGLSSRIAQRLGGITEAIKGMANGVEQIDPAVTAMHEVKSVLEPFGRGAFALFGRSPEKTKEAKRERWYKRILSAIKPKRPGMDAVAGGGEAGAGASLSGGLLGRVLPMLGTALMWVLGPIAAAIAGWNLGKLLYDWLDKSGIATKILRSM